MNLRDAGPLALLMHGQLTTGFGKLGQGMLRYSDAKIAAIVDRENAGRDLYGLTGIKKDVPIVGCILQAIELGAEVLVIGIAPSGGLLPAEWRDEIKGSLAAGMSLVNPLHGSWSRDSEFSKLVQPDRWIWDVRVEPPGIQPGTGAAAHLQCKRILTVGTDMSVGKMTAALEFTKELKNAGRRAKFIATGQVGICIAGEGVPLDAIRLDYAAGSIEGEVVRAAHEGVDFAIVEGQGALCHPASTATLALMRGALPTHLLFVHRARQTELRRMPEFAIPDLQQFIKLNEEVAACNGVFPKPITIGVALNCAELDENDARQEILNLQERIEFPVSDPVKFGCKPFLAPFL